MKYYEIKINLRCINLIGQKLGAMHGKMTNYYPNILLCGCKFQFHARNPRRARVSFGGVALTARTRAYRVLGGDLSHGLSLKA